MAVIGVDFGRDVSGQLFSAGASAGRSLGDALSGAGDLKRQLLEDQHWKNQAYMDATRAKAALDQQEYTGRENLSKAAADIERYRASQGTSNAMHAGSAAPIPVDINDARSRFAGAQQIIATGATDSAQGLNKTMGGMGLAFGPADQARTNYAIMGGHPTDSTLLGPNDHWGTDAQIKIGNAREAAKAQGDIAVNAANVPNTIAVNNAKAANELQLDPMKNADSLIYTLETKKFHQGGQLSPEEEAQLSLARRIKFPQNDITYTDAETGQHVIIPRTGDRAGDIYGGNAGGGGASAQSSPAIVPPGGFSPTTRDGQNYRNAATRSAPLIIGQEGAGMFDPTPMSPQGFVQPQSQPPQGARQDTLPLGAQVYGNRKPAAQGQDWQAKAYQQTLAQITAEPVLRRFDGTNVPNTLAGALASMGNKEVAAQFVYNSLKSQAERDFFDNAFLFITGKLRTDSGASINPSEFATMFPTIFPMQGDTPERVMHKAKVRARFIRGNMAGLSPAQLADVQNAMQEDGLDLQGYRTPGALGPRPAARPVVDFNGIEEIR